MAVVSFHCGIISCELARRGVRRGGSGGVQRVRSWQRGRSDHDHRSTAVFLVDFYIGPVIFSRELTFYCTDLLTLRRKRTRNCEN